MPQSVEAISFDYTNERDWSHYFKNQIGDFLKTAKSLYDFRQELVRKCDGMPFDELQDQWDYSQVLLGGVDEIGEYRERSLAKLYKELLGLQFEDLTEVVEKQRQNISPSTKVEVSETAFSNFLAEVLEEAERILQQADAKDIIYSSNREGEYNFHEILSDQEEFTKLLSNFLYRLQSFLPNHNQRALFVWTLPKTTERYLSVAYPKLKDKESWEWLDELLGLEQIFVPDINETGENIEEQEQQYTIYDYREGSLGDNLTKLYQQVWDGFDGQVRESLRLVFPDVPNFKQEFVNEAQDKLDQIGVNTQRRLTFELPSQERNLELAGKDENYSGRTGDTDQAEYKISGVTIDAMYISGRATSDNPQSYTRECNMSLFQVLDELSPALFLLNGLEYDLHIDQESLEVESL